MNVINVGILLISGACERFVSGIAHSDPRSALNACIVNIKNAPIGVDGQSTYWPRIASVIDAH